MKIGIVGLPLVGKTTVFNLLTEEHRKTGLGEHKRANVGVAPIPDPRIDFLISIFNPKRKAYAQIEFIDMPGLKLTSETKSSNSTSFLDSIQSVDALVNVLRAFDQLSVPHIKETIHPARDLDLIITEMLLADWDLVDKRLQNIKKMKKAREEMQREEALLKKCISLLEEEIPLREKDFSRDEKRLLKTYLFFTLKPMLAVVNESERQILKGHYPYKEETEKLCIRKGLPLMPLSAKIEEESAELPIEERPFFLKEYGITESGISALASLVYKHLGLISFFTVGADEVKAWTIKQGSTAKKAASKIHSDIARGFIRAEVVSFNDFQRLGSMAKVKEKKAYRLEGKEYIVQDGDIIDFRFNV